MQALPTSLSGVFILEPKVFGDTRGFFYESFNARRFAELTGVTTPFVQDNHSKSARHVLRGLHYQIRQAQGKLLRAVVGELRRISTAVRPPSARSRRSSLARKTSVCYGSRPVSRTASWC